jgi:hypothetical protein
MRRQRWSGLSPFSALLALPLGAVLLASCNFIVGAGDYSVGTGTASEADGGKDTGGQGKDSGKDRSDTTMACGDGIPTGSDF